MLGTLTNVSTDVSVATIENIATTHGVDSEPLKYSDAVVLPLPKYIPIAIKNNKKEIMIKVVIPYKRLH